MISDFDDLALKVSQLAELTQSLRSENAKLRQGLAQSATANMNLASRMNEAHQRVAALLAQMPAPLAADDEEEAA